ncbi:S8 family serine peptidase [Caulobacter sp. KR2-114]|uniref:S8 family serine peptidase n=1 Tax=Caulobacter sp. KR2-114 TaxID=3400912 RepID=UPI003C02286D
MSPVRILVASAMIVLLAGDSVAAEDQVIVARASSAVLDAETVRLVARQFKFTEFSGGQLEQAPTLTLRQEITQLCGAVSPAYLVEFQTLNTGAKYSFDAPLGTAADTLKWPACLKVSLLPVTPRPGEIASGAAADFAAISTAPAGQERRRVLQSFPAALNRSVQQFRGVVTTPVELRPIEGLTADDAAQKLMALQTIGGQPAAAAFVATPMRGRILETVADPTRGGAAGSTCPATSSAVDAALVQSVFDWSQKRRDKTRRAGSASIYVVDNGFFGLERHGSRFASSFPPSLFLRWSNSEGVVGPVSRFGPRTVWPNNYKNDAFAAQPDSFTPDDDASHGTHVAGLVLGGPDFQTPRDALLQDSRLDLTIIALGAGEHDLVENSEQGLQPLLTNAIGDRRELSIVNMSVAYQGGGSRGYFQSLFATMGDALFVVAAGNDSEPATVALEFPGALGDRPNVISVAAHDAAEPSRLAWFTNYGQKSVDIAAPGCGVLSWKDADHQVALSGTSTAAPIVTFAASLLASLDGSLKPAQIRTRILISGELLGGAQVRWNLVSGSKLDIPAALLLYDDLLKVRIADPGAPGGYRVETWIGQVEDSWGLRCVTDGANVSQRDRDNLWAFKRQEGEAWLFVDRPGGDFTPCPIAAGPPAGSTKAPMITFRRTARIVDHAVVPDPAPLPPQPKDLSDVEAIVFSGVN